MFDWKSRYDAFHATFPGTKHTPVIGITGNFGDRGLELGEGYYTSIEAAGGIPVAIPPTDNAPLLLTLLDRIDGLVLSGGADINPLYLDEDPVRALGGINPKRDSSELLLTRLAYDRQIPILGICRGIQMLAVALGGTIRQDIYTDDEDMTSLQNVTLSVNRFELGELTSVIPFAPRVSGLLDGDFHTAWNEGAPKINGPKVYGATPAREAAAFPAQRGFDV